VDPHSLDNMIHRSTLVIRSPFQCGSYIEFHIIAHMVYCRLNLISHKRTMIFLKDLRYVLVIMHWPCFMFSLDHAFPKVLNVLIGHALHVFKLL